ncbi:Hydantoinase/oxoprolinase-domain-containing protein [Aspergillus pseudotamarii]|uniref:Hydantoinase/oxoprolinase-domain-containing protein n=1 Tax=Aspergillus pseudotamarii TaxID=132259 RepID=A0A5N6TBJ0_ASPPS|nr:Hydantoinase/oxoprolinase-domain-containing protein [Aspergillus pseudotamarii]KAE8143748.1 Hydantoinase/oxoprolinase-domain-containing protein [Aspergillus pseudotamarii]
MSYATEHGEYRLGADVGGTFTDICAFTPDGQIARAKVPTTVEDQSIGIKNGIQKVRQHLKERYSWDGKFQFIHHGTTTATNAVLEGKGARTGLIVTAGHKDILAVRRSQIPGGLGAWLHYTPPEPIVPLERVLQCQERMSVNGESVIAVNKDALRAELKAWRKDRPEAVAVSLLNSHCNNEHELLVADIVREELGSDIPIICSGNVLREVGEYERTVTTCTNALVKPVVQSYLGNLRDLLAEDGNTIRILKSDGGLTSLDLAGELPVNILMSGPAGGVQGVADVVTRNTPYKNLITFDMGGTSTDCALIYQGKPRLRRETVVGDLTVRSPAVDIRTVGAGGGSIAKYMDITETMRVGPESAGASPGPACYRKGGVEATVTDANLVLGYLPEKLLGGEFTLDVEAAVAAVDTIASQMKLTVTQTAEDIINLVNETMYGALRLVSVEQGYDPKDFALVAFGGAGPLHANAVGKLLGAWPVIVPPSPGTLCALGDATTRLSHSQSSSYIRLLSMTLPWEVKARFDELETACRATMQSSNGGHPMELNISYHIDLRYKGQALNLTIDLQSDDLSLGHEPWKALLQAKFDQLHEQQFKYCLPNFELELMRLEVVAVDASPSIELPQLNNATANMPPAEAMLTKKEIVIEGKTLEATLWDREKLSYQGVRVQGPCIITEMDSNTLILPGCYGEIDAIGNILIRPDGELQRERPKDQTAEEAEDTVRSTPLIPTLVASALASIRSEMDTLMLRCSMSPAIREQQDEFNVITTADGKMLVGQFGSFITQFLRAWRGPIHEGDVFITNDTYMIEGAVTHLNDVIVLLPIFFEGSLIGWASQFGHLTDVGGMVPGSMSINATSIFDDGVQIPLIKLYSKGIMNTDLVDLLCRNSRQPDWYRSDLMAIIAACRTANSRVCELATRFGSQIYLAACSELLLRNRTGMAKIIETDFDDKPCTFTDFVDDDGHGVGPWALTCTMKKTEGNRLLFDWSGTSPQSEHSINFYLSETMFKMFIGYYMIAAVAPGTVINDGFHDLIDIHIPEGTVLKPIRPAAISCRTHLLGRTMDVMQALIGKKNKLYAAAAGFSDSPHFFYSGYKPDGEWYQLYQIGFGGVPARNAGDGLDCHCLFPAIKSIPTESIELNYPLRIEANESVPDSGGPGYYRGGNAQRTLYRFLCRGEFSLHDDRWFTKPWGIRGGKPGSRSRKILYRFSKSRESPPVEVLPSKCDHIRVDPDDLLEWVTWGGGGLGDPLTRPAEKVALEVRRRLVTIDGARNNYGVVVNPDDCSVCEEETVALRESMKEARNALGQTPEYDRGGSMEELRESCLRETGLPAPSPQWELDPYGPHVRLPYVRDWFTRMTEVKGWELN